MEIDNIGIRDALKDWDRVDPWYELFYRNATLTAEYNPDQCWWAVEARDEYSRLAIHEYIETIKDLDTAINACIDEIDFYADLAESEDA